MPVLFAAIGLAGLAGLAWFLLRKEEKPGAGTILPDGRAATEAVETSSGVRTTDAAGETSLYSGAVIRDGAVYQPEHRIFREDTLGGPLRVPDGLRGTAALAGGLTSLAAQNTALNQVGSKGATRGRVQGYTEGAEDGDLVEVHFFTAGTVVFTARESSSGALDDAESEGGRPMRAALENWLATVARDLNAWYPGWGATAANISLRGLVRWASRAGGYYDTGLGGYRTTGRADTRTSGGITTVRTVYTSAFAGPDTDRVGFQDPVILVPHSAGSNVFRYRRISELGAHLAELGFLL